MKQYTKKELKQLCKDIKNNFSKIIDYIIYFDKTDNETDAMDLIDKIELALDNKTEIDLLTKDFKSRSNEDKKSLFYSSIFTRLITYEVSKKELIQNLIENKNYAVLSYINSLNEHDYPILDNQIDEVIKAVRKGL